MRRIGTENLPDDVVCQRSIVQVYTSNLPNRQGATAIGIWMDSEPQDSGSFEMPESSWRGWAHRSIKEDGRISATKLSEDERRYIAALLIDAAAEVLK